MSRIVQCILVFIAVLLMLFGESLHDYLFAFMLMFFTIFLRLVGIHDTLSNRGKVQSDQFTKDGVLIRRAGE